ARHAPSHAGRCGVSGPAVFRLPDLGEGLTEAEIVEWKVAVGDVVAVDQPVVEVETAKAAVEVPSPVAGTVTELYAEAGAVVDVGAPLLAVSAPAENAPVDGGVRDAAPAPPAERMKEHYREEERAGSGNVLGGYGRGAAPVPRRAAPMSSPPRPPVPGRRGRRRGGSSRPWCGGWRPRPASTSGRSRPAGPAASCCGGTSSRRSPPRPGRRNRVPPGPE